MIWVAWRQQRAQVFVLLGLLVAGYVTVLLLRGAMQSDVTALGGCLNEEWTSKACSSLVSAFKNSWFGLMTGAETVVTALPVLLGMFCTAPLIAREIEHGTHLLAFTQSIGRTRWMLTKFAVAAVPAIAVLLLMQQGVSSWLDLAGKFNPREAGPYQGTTFGTTSVAPLSYVLFCLSFGLMLGVLTRRSLVAMAGTLATFVVLRSLLGQAYGLVGSERVISDDPTTAQPGSGSQYSEYLDSGYLSPQGETISKADAEPLIAQCPAHTNGTVTPGLADCYRQHGLAKLYIDELPPSAAPAVHWTEFAIVTGLALLCLPIARQALHRRV
ncbi:ABC-2 family transporter [Amycolatopsis sulphurea]|uniref:ABC-2 family transporter n=1 Tax=Amycolatopsis sulphurea TaxID=76022 RepID=A0A2A9FKJ4_9PSEU|nr:ABC transporter permease subunit [Amycolatopsis sulphurea]PFG50955.1 ABC-2 family transporter [Amycolatopsis sulphurea]